MSTLQTIISRGTAASRPAAASLPAGSLYFATDTQILSRSNGSSWDSFGPALLVGDSGAGGTAGFAPAPGAGDAAAGKFLKADGTWAVPPAGVAPALILLEEHTAATSATINFVTRNVAGQSGAIFASDYDDYLFEFINVIPVTNAVDSYIRFSTNGGSTYDSTSLYNSTIWAWAFNGSTQAGQAIGSPVGQITFRASADVGNDAHYGLNGFARVQSPLNTGVYKRFHGDITYVTNGAVIEGVLVRGFYQNTTAVNAMQFLFSSGNISSGTIRAYGISK